MCYTTNRLSAKSINYYIFFIRMVKHIHIIFFKEFMPSPLPNIQFFLGEPYGIFL